jgi:hypothetical protein
MRRIEQNERRVNSAPRARSTEVVDDFARDNWWRTRGRSSPPSGPSNYNHSHVVRIVTALGGHGSECHCPAHDDARASLSVGFRDGRVLVHCHAGCSQAAVIEALRSLNLWPHSTSAQSRHHQESAAEREAKAIADEQRRERTSSATPAPWPC